MWTPRVVSAVVLLLLALIMAKVIERTVRSVLTRVKLGAVMERLGLDDTLKRVGVAQPLEHLLPRLVYLLLLVLVARTLAESLGLGPVSDAIGAFFAYLPNVVSAVVILLFGTVVANLAGQMVSRGNPGSTSLPPWGVWCRP